jgi:hypothetical protein
MRTANAANAADALSVKPMERVSAIKALVTAQDQATRHGAFNVGEQYQAEVLSRSAEGQPANVRLDGTLFKMELPPQLAPGQTLTLKYLSNSPDPTFLLLKTDLAPNTQVNNIVLSQAASNIGQFINQIGNSLPISAPHQSGTILNAPPDQTSLTTDNLKLSIVHSGLFYESHLAGFLQGKYELSGLAQEPQNKFGFDPATIVVKQLEILEQNKIHLNGEVWPNQNMDWTISVEKRPERDPEAKQQNRSQAENEPIYSSVMKFNFAHLGNIKATLQIHNGNLHLKFETSSTLSTQLLKSQTNGLAVALESLGQKLETISVSRHGA